MITLLAPLIVQAVSPVFAPPLDTPLSYRTSEVRQDGARTQRFTIDRRVTFQTATDGVTATIETLAVAGDAGGAGVAFEAIARSTLGRHIVLRLDSTGKVVDVDDLDAVWNAQIAAIVPALVVKDPARVAAVDALVAPLRALPRATKIARIGDMIAPLIADISLTPGPPRAITMPARGQDGSAAMLAGTERVIAESDRRLLLERRASGIVSGSPMEMSVRRRFDPRTRLAAETINIRTFETAGKRMIVTRSTVIIP